MKPYPRLGFLLGGYSLGPRNVVPDETIRPSFSPSKTLYLDLPTFQPFSSCEHVVCVCVWTVSNIRRVLNPVVTPLALFVLCWPVRARPLALHALARLSCPSARDFFWRLVSSFSLSYFGMRGERQVERLLSGLEKSPSQNVGTATRKGSRTNPTGRNFTIS